MGKPKVPTAPFKLKIPHIMLFLYSLHVVLHLFYSKKEKAKLESSWLKLLDYAFCEIFGSIRAGTTMN